MSNFLVIVESPTKAKTISSFLGSDYEIVSSKGHLVDLPASKLAVDIKGDFSPMYSVLSGKKKIISQLKKKAKEKEAVYLATDPDREGEAISWHIKEQLDKKGQRFYRVIFHEITEEAIKEALAKPADLDTKKVEAQMARRVLDRVVGYRLSPLLWKKIVRGLSAGRVQSVALRFIVEREREIEKFTPEITYSLEAELRHQEKFTAKLQKYKNKKAVFKSRKSARQCRQELKDKEFTVESITKKESKRRPYPPYITSSLQQDAFNKLRFSAQKSMVVAQQLYEGIDLAGKNTGLITYMRTDSFSVSQKARNSTRGFISAEFGKNFLAAKKYRHKKKKGAQLAHEAIRPTEVKRRPEEIEAYLSKDQYRLYKLIWQRFVASFMAEAVFENRKIKITAEKNALFSAEDKKMVFPGFMKIYPQEPGVRLPDLKEGEKLDLEGLEIKKHSTKPPPRYNDASLIKILEEKGIGRPSTYAPTVFTLIKRNYARREKSALYPTDLGIKVMDFLRQHFSKIMDYDFTADMEKKLDMVEEGKIVWNQILKNFYPDFQKQVEKVSQTVKKEVVYSDKTCPQCGGRLVKKWSRKGQFLSCENFPRCRYAESITTGIICPECKKGEVVRRRNRRGQNFYGCTNFPDCRFTIRSLDQLKESPEQEDKH